MEHIPNYEERESMKQKGWDAYRSDCSTGFKTHGLLLVISSHYWRARASLEKMPKAFQRKVHGKRYSPGHELEIDVYIRHWLFANCTKMAIDPLVIECLNSVWHYKPEKHPLLHDGKTIYCESAW